MITLDKFTKNINLLHLAYISGNEDVCLRIINGLIRFFPYGKSDIEHFCFFCNFGLLEGHESSIENLYDNLNKKNN